MPTGERVALDRLLTRVAEFQASDLHLTVGSPPTLRVAGKLVTIPEEPFITPDFLTAVLDELLTDDQRAVLEKDRRCVLTYDYEKKARFKVDIYYQRNYPSAAFRYIDPVIPSIRELGLPAIVEKFTEVARGLVIVAGPFASGRSATVAAIVNAINMTKAKHIVTIERPVEYLFVNAKSMVEQREIGRDTPSASQALDNVYQEDVDVVVVASFDDPDVVERGLRVAESGRLVIAAMTADSAMRVIEKMVTGFSDATEEQHRILLAETLQGIICQRLLPKIGGGSVVAAEVLTATRAIRSVIHDGAIQQIQTILQTSREEGMIPLDRALADRVKSGEVLLDDALSNAHDQNSLRLLLESSRVS